MILKLHPNKQFTVSFEQLSCCSFWVRDGFPLENGNLERIRQQNDIIVPMIKLAIITWCSESRCTDQLPRDDLLYLYGLSHESSSSDSAQMTIR